jgi:hypothetical protein
VKSEKWKLSTFHFPLSTFYFHAPLFRAFVSDAVNIAQISFASDRSEMSELISPSLMNSSQPTASSDSSTAIPSFAINSARERPRCDAR